MEEEETGFSTLFLLFSKARHMMFSHIVLSRGTESVAHQKTGENPKTIILF